MSTVANTKNRERALQPPSAIYRDLLASPRDVVISANEAAAIWRIFRDDEIGPKSLQRLEYRAFLQACVMSAQDASAAMSWVETIFKSAYRPNATVRGVLAALARRALQKYYLERVGVEQPIYESVLTSIRWGHRTYFEMISQGMDI